MSVTTNRHECNTNNDLLESNARLLPSVSEKERAQRALVAGKRILAAGQGEGIPGYPP